ncbi:TIR domain-containing protein [Pimelobacter simplex]|uniref:TIR domain-containing protein n=1 Tax=Nocardioides simplex TaxID=2045 RepID=UPI0008DF1E75|nr:TIR domain-containing protein [Pimelobacter simplex]MCG8151244.1 TIR domain-containing protein [Pimelobacter simplex]GEB12203.1 hypothetical protein NSI01_05180 [Pimelobacter simplex]SFN16734.1 TIR domain-containing protein [Pimelobacter simplex]
MTYFTATELRARTGGLTASAAGKVLANSAQTEQNSFDVFLSHSMVDAAAVLGLMEWLESLGFSVYVDWVVDSELDRSKVDQSTAALLRQRMRQSSTLVYATSRAAQASKWMPWELGYFDGIKGQAQVAICPIETGAMATHFIGQEYLNLYKALEKLFVNGEPVPYVTANNTTRAQTMASFIAGSGQFEKVKAS